MGKVKFRNGIRHTLSTKMGARDLRQNGWTHREIVNKLRISLGSAVLWTKGIILTDKQKRAIQERIFKPTFTKERREKLRRLAKINLARFWKHPYSKQELLDKIRDFYTEHGRIPLKREFNMYEEYKLRFGSWNNAIQIAGFDPNPVVYSKKFVAKDGHMCDSFVEKIIDDWLLRNRIVHERNFPYAGTKMTADFTVGKLRIEYFGLAGENEAYDKTIHRKRDFCVREGLKLFEIYPRDLFSDSESYKRCLGNILKEVRGSV